MSAKYPPLSKGGSSKEFEVHPTGEYQMVLADVWEPELVTRYDEERYETKFVFLSSESDSSGRPFLMWSRPMKWTLHEAGNLCKFLAEMSDDPIPDNLDPDTLIGTNVWITVAHRDWQGKTYSNIKRIRPIGPKDEPIEVPAEFERRHEKKAREEAGQYGNWADVVCHVGSGKLNGMKLGEMGADELRVLREEWLPKAKAKGVNATPEDVALMNALQHPEVDEAVGDEEEPEF